MTTMKVVRVMLQTRHGWTLQKKDLSSNSASLVSQFHPMPGRFQTPRQLSIWYWGFIIWFHAKENYRLNLPASLACEEHCLHDKCGKRMKSPLCCQATLSWRQQTQRISKWFGKGQLREPRQPCVPMLTEGTTQPTSTLYLIRANQPWASFSLCLICYRLLIFEVLGNISFWFIILGFRAAGWKKVIKLNIKTEHCFLKNIGWSGSLKTLCVVTENNPLKNNVKYSFKTILTQN